MKTPDLRRAALALSLFALTALLSFPLSAQKKVPVEGEVQNTQGKAVGKVSWTLVAADGTVAASGAADKKGRFKATVLPGSYTSQLAHPDYATTEKTLEIGENGSKLGLKILTGPELAGNTFNDGVGLLQSGEPDAALEKFLKARELDPTLPQAPLGIALVKHGKQEWDQAAQAVDKVMELAPGQPMVPPVVLYDIALNTDRQDWRDQAKAQLVGTPAATDAAKGVYNKGVRAANAEDDEAAVAAFTEALELDPKLPAAHQSLAAIYFNKGEHARALPFIDSLLAVAPTNAAGQRMAFFSHMELGDTQKAGKAFGVWSGEASSAAGEVLEQAENLFKANQQDKALSYAEAMLIGAPDNARAHYLKGRVLAATGQVAAAKSALQRFLDLAPDDAEAAAARQMMEGL